MRISLLLLTWLVACGREDRVSSETPPDLTEALGADEARAGVVTDAAALMGGISAEGALGDVKIYNDQVQFILQGVRESDYYIAYGGGLLDADVIRAEGEPGRDLIDEGSPMIGFGRIVEADEVTVQNDGTDGGPAVVVVTGHGAPFKLLTGAVESPELVADLEMQVTTSYTLEPGSPLLRMTTTVAYNDEPSSLLLGDVLLLAYDVSDSWIPGRGFDGDLPDTLPYLAAVSRKNEVAMGIFPDGEIFINSPLLAIMDEAAPVLAALVDTVPLEEGDSTTWSRSLGVARDPATLADAWYSARGVGTETLTGTVTAGSAPVAGARVHLLDADGVPVGLTFSDETGNWAANLPSGSATSAVASGRGTAISVDLPEGAGWYGPYADELPQETTLASLENGAVGAAFAEGYGLSETLPLSADTALSLIAPGQIAISTGDGLPAVVRVSFESADPLPRADILVPGRPNDLAALAFLRDGEGTIPVEPGDYTVVVHRGPRWEMSETLVSVSSGGTAEVSAALTRAYETPQVWTFDAHAHAAPSSDSSLPMEDRLIVAAAHGLDIHLGTDHDHVADYRPLLAPLGLDAVLNSVVADEVSPVLRGHFNTWPLEPALDRSNHGALAWWDGIVDTETLFQDIRAMGGSILSVNHPSGSSGMLGHAAYANGAVAHPDHWSSDFDAIEVLNAADYESYLPDYLDLVNHGLAPAALGVSDSHSHKDSVGISFTFVHSDEDAPFSTEALVAAVQKRATVVSRGPYIDARVGESWAPGMDFVGAQSLAVTVYAPSWMPLDTLSLLCDGEVVETLPITGTEAARISASFALVPEKDASYIVIASGSEAMNPVYPGRLPWAMTAAMRIDVEGDGWDPPGGAFVN